MKYRWKNDLGVSSFNTTMSHKQVERMITYGIETQEEKDRVVREYLKNKNAVAFSDMSLIEFQAQALTHEKSMSLTEAVESGDLGAVLWCVSRIASEQGLCLSEVAEGVFQDISLIKRSI